jgi:hypothetical protein
MSKYYHDTPEGRVPFTPEQEAHRDAEIAAWEAGAIDRKAEEVRQQRNKLLAESDWTQIADAPFDADGKLAWALYREFLRMIPQQEGFPETVNWPPKPQ